MPVARRDSQTPMHHPPMIDAGNCCTACTVLYLFARLTLSLCSLWDDVSCLPQAHYSRAQALLFKRTPVERAPRSILTAF
eukprot:1141018-Pelagomonas_calceolata.AAC.8